MGITQGLAEFLPVSSSGHLVLLQNLMGLSGEMLYFDILMHAATLLAVVIVFRKDILWLITHPLSKDSLLLVMSAIPTVIIAVVFKAFIEDSFGGNYLWYGFLTTAVFLLLTDIFVLRKNRMVIGGKLNQIKTRSAAMMGIAQGLAVLPGVSRSGATVCTGLVMRENRETAARFSFLMSIPVIVGSALMGIIDAAKNPGMLAFSALPLIAGFVFAFIFGILSIKLMLKIIKNRRLWPFVPYLAALSVIAFIFVK